MKKSEKNPVTADFIESSIYLLRGQKVMLDTDLALLYGVKVKRLNEQVKRNKERFPEDFMFQLSDQEKDQLVAFCDHLKSLKFSSSNPYAFTEQGVAMLSGVLRSAQAISVNIEIMRAFVKMRRIMVSQEKFDKDLKEVRTFLLKHSRETDVEFRKIWQAIEALTPAPEPEWKIGFRLSE